MKRRIFLAIIAATAAIMPSSLHGGNTIVDFRHVFQKGELVPNGYYQLYPEDGRYLELSFPAGQYFNCEICICTSLEQACGCVLDYFREHNSNN